MSARLAADIRTLQTAGFGLGIWDMMDSVITAESPGQNPITAMGRQLEHEDTLSSRLEMPWDRIVALERIARGAGATRWYLARSRDDVRRAFALLGPGSRVTFYFAGPLRVETLSEPVIGDMFVALEVSGELVVAAHDRDPLVLDAEFTTGPSELTEWLMRPQPPPGDIVWGPFPGEDEPDAITVVLVDADGVVRPHPH